MNVQFAKELVWGVWQPIADRPRPFVPPSSARFAPDVVFHGPAPIGAAGRA